MYAVIWHNPFCITLLSSLYGGRQQRVRRPPNNVYDDRRTCCWRPPYNNVAYIMCRALHSNGVSVMM